MTPARLKELENDYGNLRNMPKAKRSGYEQTIVELLDEARHMADVRALDEWARISGGMYRSDYDMSGDYSDDNSPTYNVSLFWEGLESDHFGLSSDEARSKAADFAKGQRR